MVLQQKPPVVVLACGRLPQLPEVCMEDATFTGLQMTQRLICKLQVMEAVTERFVA